MLDEHERIENDDGGRRLSTVSTDDRAEHSGVSVSVLSNDVERRRRLLSLCDSTTAGGKDEEPGDERQLQHVFLRHGLRTTGKSERRHRQRGEDHHGLPSSVVHMDPGYTHAPVLAEAVRPRRRSVSHTHERPASQRSRVVHLLFVAMFIVVLMLAVVAIMLMFTYLSMLHDVLSKT